MSYARNKRAKERRRNRAEIINIEKLEKQRKENLQKEILENEEKIKTLIKVEEEIGMIGFREQQPRKIGLNNGDKAPNSTNMFKILLQFNKTESIDVLIHALNETKEMMKNRKEIINRVERKVRE